MNDRSNPNFMILLTAFTLIIGAGVNYFQYTVLSGFSEKVEKLKIELKDEHSIATKLAEAEVRLDESAKKLAHLEQGVPQFAYVPTMLRELEDTGKLQGIEVLGVRPTLKDDKKQDTKKKKKEKKPYEELNIEVKGRGSWAAINSFLTSLQEFPKIVTVKTVELQPKRESQRTYTALDVTIDLKAYLFAPKVDATKSDSAEAETTTATSGGA